MTIYVDDFHLRRASRIPAPTSRTIVNVSHMIGDDRAELHAFARTLGLGDAWFTAGSDVYRMPVQEARKAVLLGAVPVTTEQLAAMVALRHLGETLAPVDTAQARRRAIALEGLP